jgi:hypothetical protein
VIVTRDKQTAAVDRYRAMAGLLKKLPPKAARRAKADQKHHAIRYVTRRRGRPVCDPLKMVRFLVDVCGLTLKEASCAVREAILAGGCGAWPGAKDSKGMAKRLYRDTRDVLEAVAMARFFGWASGRAEPWDDVRAHLASMTMVRESTGLENWQAR